jgi:hypothetical protein
MKEFLMRFLTVIIDTVLVFFVAKISFDYFSGKEGIFLLNAAPAGVVFIYSIGYFAIMDINRHAAAMYRVLVGVFVAVAMLIHSTTISFFLDGEAVWKTIALIIAGVTLFSTQFITRAIAEYSD